MKYLTFLLFLLGGFLNQIEGQTILDYGTYIQQLQDSSDPLQNSEATRITDYATKLYPTIYYDALGIHVQGGSHYKKLITNVETLNSQLYEPKTLPEVEMLIILVREESLISTGQIPSHLMAMLPSLKNVLIIAEFPSLPSDFNSILTPSSIGYVPLLKVSLTQ